MEVSKDDIVELIGKAVIYLPEDIKQALKKSIDVETNEIAKNNLNAILKNIELGEKTNTPICQDTGILIFYVENPIQGIEDIIYDGTKNATKKIPLRPNAVHPITRINSDNNTGINIPYIYYKYTSSNRTKITVMPKGAGSENMCKSAMLLPTKGLKGIKEFVIEVVVSAFGNPCPPIVLGVGVGGSADISAKLAKEALLRDINISHSDNDIAKLENDLLQLVNMTGIGPMGLGGKTTCLGVNIEVAHCHTACLPVSVAVQCWAARKATLII